MSTLSSICPPLLLLSNIGTPSALQWWPTVAGLPLVSCWNEHPPHKQFIICESVIVWVKFSSIYHQRALRMHQVIRCARRWEEDGCVWHVNSNQGSDIHQAPWPPVRINLGREELQAPFFSSISVCHSCSLFPFCFFYHSLPVFFYLSICPLRFYQTLMHFLSACQFSSLIVLRDSLPCVCVCV